MIRHPFRLNSVGLIVAVVFCLAFSIEPIHGQIVSDGGSRGTPNSLDTLTLTGSPPSAVDYILFPFDTQGGTGVTGGLLISPLNISNSAFNIMDNVNAGSFSVGQNGVGIGLNSFNSNQVVGSTLHVAGGPNLAYSNAPILIDDRNNDGVFRQLLTLRNGGPSSLRFADTTNSQNWQLDTFNQNFNIFDQSAGRCPLIVAPGSPQNMVRINPTGVGIGFGAPGAVMHVRTSANNNLRPANGSPHVLIDDTNPTSNPFLPLNLLQLRANDAVSIMMTDLSTGQQGVGTNFALINGQGSFQIMETQNNQNIPFFIGSGAPHNLLNLDPSGGVGVNTGAGLPVLGMLHVTADGSNNAINNQGGRPLIRAEFAQGLGTNDERTAMDLRNNGNVNIVLNNTDPTNPGTYRIRASGDRMILQNLGGNVLANATIFKDGNVRYSVGVNGQNASPNMTIRPNGDVRIIGQRAGALPSPNNGAGGNLIVQGGNFNGQRYGGNLTVNGNATVRGRINGQIIGGSDRNIKENIELVDGREILDKVVAMPISTWNYKREKDDVPHMGPMAQDFYAAFKLGINDKTIFDIDRSGVALAAIQGLNQKIESKDEEITELKNTVDELTQRLERLEALLAPQQK